MSEWRKHVQKTYAEMKKKNPKVLLKHAMKAGSITWKKKTQKKGGSCGGTDNVVPSEDGSEETLQAVGGDDEEDNNTVGGAVPKPIGGRKLKKSKKVSKTKKNRK